ncbi:MAG: hypothetical protein JRF63_05970, partial [Deltaproteobacteria bacterium]|nr:hypothetical protein [Deltaproteobacteria bacterium]
QEPGAGPALGTWVGQRTYTWGLDDAEGNQVLQGPYLVSVGLSVDRSGPASNHYPDFIVADVETCWDDPSADGQGMQRAEGIITVGSGAETVYLEEKGHGTVDGCKWVTGTDNRIRCSCSNSTWPCPAEPISIPGLVGGPLEFFVQDRLNNPGAGQDYPVRVEYCPSGC